MPENDKITAEKLNQLEANFIRNVSHELRTPLTIIQGFANLLQDGTFGQLAPDQQNAILFITKRTEQLKTMVERINMLLLFESSQPAKHRLSLRPLVDNVIDARQFEVQEAGLNLEVRNAAELTAVLGDGYQLQHAIDILVENAIKFTPKGGRIEIELASEPGWVVLKVTDTGIGIAEDHLPYLFNFFFQADGSTTRHHGGIGLGLKVVKTVLDNHGGHIIVESRLDEGTTITMKIPPALESTPSPAVSAPQTRRILIVDDEERLTFMLQAGLRKLPHCDVLTATSGQEAKQLFQQQPFDLLITDYKMPDTDGITLARYIQEFFPRTAIVMITAYGGERDLRGEAGQTAIKRILDKPVRLQEIRSVALEMLTESTPTQISN
ncbi:MAG TPA: ATP-binding protein [Anaerolineae bacterium]|nr:ATP-binding protein [Anaerolineae bacterium]HMR63442.1 ATP-binding protein [Anaerolineae bacterium]